MVLTKKIAVDLANRYPASFIVMSHEMNVQSFKVVLAVYNEGEAVVFNDSDIATATLVSDGYLVCTERECNILNNEVTVDITNDVGHTSNIPAGEMQIEICIKNGDTVFYIPYISAYVAKAIQDDATVTPTSYGTVASAVSEVATARGDYATLAERFTSIDNDISNAVTNIIGNNSEISAIGNTVNRHTSEILSIETDTRNLKDAVNEARGDYATLAERFTSIDNDISNAVTNIIGNNSEISAIGNTVNRHNSEILLLENNLGELQDTVGTVNMALETVLNGGI